MPTSFYEELGLKIRAFRKAKHIPLSDVAKAINKSLSTVAKYETGEISIDIESLLLVCSFLNISVSDLLPETRADSLTENSLRYQKHFVDRVYVYYYRGYDRWIHKCVIDNDNVTMKSTLYFGVSSEHDYHDCTDVYLGNVYYSDVNTYYVYFNTKLPFDMLTINAPTISRDRNYQIGLISSITVYYQNMAGKVLISKDPIGSDVLSDKLPITSQEIKDLKRTNFFIV